MTLFDTARKAAEAANDVLYREVTDTVVPAVVVFAVIDDAYVYPTSSGPDDEVIAGMDVLLRAAMASTLRALADKWEPGATAELRG